MRIMLVLVTSVALASVASADIFAVDLGLGPNPLPSSFVLGPYTVEALPDDLQPTGYTSVVSAPGSPPLTGDVTFSPDLLHAQVGVDWVTWASGRTPDVYYSGDETAISLGMPASTGAFALWVEPEPFSVFDITVRAEDEEGNLTSLTAPVDGAGGARGFGFYATSGQEIISVSVGENVNFAVGEFYGARVPEPAALSLLALGGIAFLRRR